MEAASQDDLASVTSVKRRKTSSAEFKPGEKDERKTSDDDCDGDLPILNDTLAALALLKRDFPNIGDGVSWLSPDLNESYGGYLCVRSRLPIPSDKKESKPVVQVRPFALKTQLYTVLKNRTMLDREIDKLRYVLQLVICFTIKSL